MKQLESGLVSKKLSKNESTLLTQIQDKVKKLAFVEMILPGFGLEDWSFLTTENVNSNRWLWHINFYSVPDFPEFLITGRERQ